jgi:aspartate dehydrogenase
MNENSEPARVGLIGCGAIAKLIAEAVQKKLVVCDELILFDQDEKKAEGLSNSLRFPVTIVSGIEEMFVLKPKVVVEAASQQAARDYTERIAAKGVDVIVMSTGALLGLNLQSSKIHVPAGAIGGLDALSTAVLAGIDEVFFTSRKNPRTFEMDNTEAKVVYEGTAEEAARLYPRKMNVAATLALAVKPAKVQVQVISDPAVQRNIHEFRVKWRFGEMFLRFANDPHPENPRTSALAAWSAIKMLQVLLKNT